MKNFPKIPVANNVVAGTNTIINEEENVVKEDENIQVNLDNNNMQTDQTNIEDRSIEQNEELNNVTSEIDQKLREAIPNNNQKEVYKLENIETEGTRKYKILDLLWLFNGKILNTAKDTHPVIEEDESHLCTINYNISFGNLKVTFYHIPPGAVVDNVVFLKSLKTLVSGCIYPSSCARILFEDECVFTCHEQLFTNTGEQWQSERPHVNIVKKKDYIIINMYNKLTNQTYKQLFSDWQYKALLNAMQFVLSNGYKLSGQNIINVSK